MWSRGKIEVRCVEVSESVLPMRGSAHPAFVDMLFLWKGPHEEDPSFRHVVLPYGFSLSKISKERHEIKDLNGFVRAVVLLPTGKKELPSIVPVRRFSCDVEQLDNVYRGKVGDWDTVVFRTPRFKTQQEALNEAKKWLDTNQPKWDSYVSQINFGRRP